jgi:putative transposase
MVPADKETMMERGELPNRRLIRLKGYDYSRDGAYFVTICTQGREHTFGAVIKGKVRLNACGREVARCWAWLAEQYPYVYLDEWIVMPDHTHAIIVIRDDHRNGTVRDGSSVTNPNVADADLTNSNEICRGGSRTALQRSVPDAGFMGPSILPTQRKPLGRLIGAFKTVSTNRVNDIRSTPGVTLWQRNYYERAIRNSISLRALRRYITNNSYL